MKPIKIVVMGPRGVGKTTMIKKISQITIASTSKLGTGSRKKSNSRKNAMDVGRINISSDYALYLFSCQGMEQLIDSWETYADGLIGFILIVDGEVKESFRKAKKAIKIIKSKDDIPYIVGSNRISEKDAKKEMDLENEIKIQAFDANNKNDVKVLVNSFLETALQLLKKAN